MLNGASNSGNWRYVKLNPFHFWIILTYLTWTVWLQIKNNVILPQISIQPVFRQRPEMKSDLIPDMVKNRRVTSDMILEYCRWFPRFNLKAFESLYVSSLLKEFSCLRVQSFWSRSWPCDSSVHYHVTAASRGWGRSRWSEHRPGRNSASVSCRHTGACDAGHPHVTQLQGTHCQSLCGHTEGLSGDKWKSKL